MAAHSSSSSKRAKTSSAAVDYVSMKEALMKAVDMDDEFMAEGMAEADSELASLIANYGHNRPDYVLKLEEERLSMKKFNESMRRLNIVHVDIVIKQHMFVEERNKWVADNLHLHSDMNKYFVERCRWETQFKECYLKPLYEERRIAAQGIDRFWGVAIAGDKLVSKQITDKDFQVLKFLNDIESNRTTDLKGFELKFTFGDNPYFKNKVLTKTYEVMGDNESVSLTAFGTKINWNPAHKITRVERRKSFFCNFFKSYAIIDPLSFDKKADKLKGDLPTDYEIGTKFRDKIIPHATYSYAPSPSPIPLSSEDYGNFGDDAESSEMDDGNSGDDDSDREVDQF